MTQSRGARTVRELVSVLGDDVVGIVGRDDRLVSAPAPISSAHADAISFCSASGDRALQLLESSMAGTVLVASGESYALVPDRTYVLVKNPRRDFLRLVARNFAPDKPAGIHATAVVDERARIHPDAYIGARAVVGACEIGPFSVVHAGVVLYDGVRLGSRVVIHAGAILGADGFGYARAENGSLEKFIHLGGVRVDDDVEIGANACIDRGTLGDTIIRRGAKIDNLVHIAHNCDIGEDAVVIAQSLIGGSTVVGARAWIAPCSCVRDGLTIGSDATVGMGAVVTKDVPQQAVVMGAPARDAAEYKQLLGAMSKLSSG